jgi:crotonobetainyl-CoA:carnitine CoA-transferase CaiB-like acyl-CoA transferase
MTRDAGSLDEIRVLDAGISVQGPLAAQLLGDLGAEVVKVEMPGAGDPVRWVPASATERRAPWFIACNRGKKSLCLDLRRPRGAETFLALCRVADVVVSNFMPGTMERWGLGYDEVAAVNPSVIYASGSAFGAEGSRSQAAGLDLCGQAASGFVTMNDPGTGGHAVGVTIADHLAGLNLAIGILAALVRRGASGRGERVATSLTGAMIAAQAPEMTAYALSGEPAPPSEGGHGLLPLVYGVFPTSDGGIAITRVPDRRRTAFWAAVGLAEVSGNPAFHGRLTAGRKKELFTRLGQALQRETTATWCNIFARLGVDHAAVRSYAEVQADRDVFVNGYLQRVDHPRWGSVVMPGSAISMLHAPVAGGKVAPELGEHTPEVLRSWLGLGEQEIKELQTAGVV